MFHVTTAVPIMLGAANALDLHRAVAMDETVLMITLACVVQSIVSAGYSEIAWLIVAPVLFWMLFGAAAHYGAPILVSMKKNLRSK